MVFANIETTVKFALLAVIAFLLYRLFENQRHRISLAEMHIISERENQPPEECAEKSVHLKHDTITSHDNKWVSPYDTEKRRRKDVSEIIRSNEKQYGEAVRYIYQLKPTSKGEFFDSLGK